MLHLKGVTITQMQLIVSGGNLVARLPELLIFQERGQVLIFTCWQVTKLFRTLCRPNKYIRGSSLVCEP